MQYCSQRGQIHKNKSLAKIDKPNILRNKNVLSPNFNFSVNGGHRRFAKNSPNKIKYFYSIFTFSHFHISAGRHLHARFQPSPRRQRSGILWSASMATGPSEHRSSRSADGKRRYTGIAVFGIAGGPFSEYMFISGSRVVKLICVMLGCAVPGSVCNIQEQIVYSSLHFC